MNLPKSCDPVICKITACVSTHNISFTFAMHVSTKIVQQLFKATGKTMPVAALCCQTHLLLSIHHKWSKNSEANLMNFIRIQELVFSYCKNRGGCKKAEQRDSTANLCTLPWKLQAVQLDTVQTDYYTDLTNHWDHASWEQSKVAWMSSLLITAIGASTHTSLRASFNQQCEVRNH